MIAGIGIDSVEITRFANWEKYPEGKLSKLFSEQEITYCLQTPKKAAERFAARFAVKEAFYKALSQILPNNTIPLLTICKNITVLHEDNGNPQLDINWNFLLENHPDTPNHNTQQSFKSFVSITHTQEIATAIVLIENIS